MTSMNKKHYNNPHVRDFKIHIRVKYFLLMNDYLLYPIQALVFQVQVARYIYRLCRLSYFRLIFRL